MSSTTGLQIASKYKRKGRASRTLSQLWQVPTFIAGLVAVAVVAASASFRQDDGMRRFNHDIKQLRQVLAQKKPIGKETLAIAKRLTSNVGRVKDHAGLIHYLTGAVLHQLTRQQPDQAAQQLENALYHLQKAQLLGVPENDNASLHALLGHLYFEQHDYAKAITVLTAAAEMSSPKSAAVLDRLVQSHLRAAKPDYKAALTANQEQLKLPLKPEAVYHAWLTRGQIYTELKDWDNAYKAFNQIDKDAPVALQVKARVLQAGAAESQGQFARALDIWQQLIPEAKSVPGGLARLWYGIGTAYQHIQPPNVAAAIVHLEKTVQNDGEIAQAARLRLAELYLHAAQPNPQLALEHLETALFTVESVKQYRNRWLDIQALREILDDAWEILRTGPMVSEVDRWAVAYEKVTPAGVGREKMAVVLESYARAAKKRSDGARFADLFRRAAVAYEKASRSFDQKKKAVMLWRSAICYREAGKPAEAVPILNQYVVTETVVEHQAKGWYTLAKTYVALENFPQARQAFEQCMQFPDTPFAYQARFQLALDAETRGDVAQAITLLQANRAPTGTTIHRKTHEDSVYKLASLYLTKTDYDKAYFYLQEASRQYPHNPQVFVVRNQLAGVYRAMGEETGLKLQKQVPEHLRGVLLKERRKWLKLAADTYDQLADTLNNKQQRLGKKLDKTERRMLQRAEFSAGDMHMGLNDYDEAMRRYQALLLKYPAERAGLLAGERIFHCMGFMRATPKQQKRAQQTVVYAMGKMTEYLNVMSVKDPAFENTPDQEVRTKNDWSKWVQWVNQLLQSGNSAPLKVKPNQESTSKKTSAPNRIIPKKQSKQSPAANAPQPQRTPPIVTNPVPSAPSPMPPPFVPPKI